MKHLKYFENMKDSVSFDINDHSHLFMVEDDHCIIELYKEELIVIKELLLDKKYNTYESDGLYMYIYNDILTIMDDTGYVIDVPGILFGDMIKCIDEFYNKVCSYKKYTGDKYEDSNFSKTIVDDSVRAAEKYNL